MTQQDLHLIALVYQQGGPVRILSEVIEEISRPVTEPIRAFLEDQLYDWY